MSTSAIPEIVKFAFDNCEFYRNLYSTAGITRESLEQVSYEDLPIITKQDIVDNFDQIITLDGWNRTRLEKLLDEKGHFQILQEHGFLPVQTSGTSSSRGLLVYDVPALQCVGESLGGRIENEQVRQCQRKLKMMYIGTLGLNLAGELLARLTASEQLEVKLVDVRTSKAELVREIQEFQPDSMACYASTLHHIANYITEYNIKLSPMHLKVSAEPLSDKMHKEIMEAFGCSVYDLYIATENLAAFGIRENPGDSFEHFEQFSMIEQCPQSDNLILTNLYNKAFPLIRYQTEDLVDIEVGENGKRHIKALNGRDIFILPIYDNGEQVKDIETSNLDMLFYEAPISNLQFIVQGNDVEITYVSEEDHSNVLEKSFRDMLRNNDAEQLVNLSISKVDEVFQNPKTGKVDLVVYR
jgi:phenylacetate-CoA ligase